MSTIPVFVMKWPFI